MSDSLRKKAKQQHPGLYKTLLFLVRFNILAIPLYLLLWIDFNPLWLRELNSWLTGDIIRFLGIDVTQGGTIVDTAHLSMDVSTDSTGWKSYIALSALIIALTDYPWRERALGICGGLVLVFFGNLARLVTMIYLVEVFGVSYDLIHNLFWRWGLTLLIFLYWAGFLIYGDQLSAWFETVETKIR